MRLAPVAVAVALAAALLSTRASAEPLGPSMLVRLFEAGLTDEAIIQLADAQGFEHALDATDVLALREAGLPAGLVSKLVTMSAGRISVEERDGVTVITGRGPEESPETQEQSAAPAPAAMPGPSAAQQQVIVVQAPPASVTPAPATDDALVNGYPVGATFGWTGGAVFLPARFGGSEPSAFGRTIVAVAPVPPYCAAPVATCVPLADTLASTDVEPAHRIAIRTSRGRLWIPN
jgi:hypothetical protein